MFQVVMNKVSTEMTGTNEELCKGLCYYVEHLNKVVDIETIKKVFNYAIKEIEDRNATDNTIKVNEDITVHKINTKDLSEEEVAKIIAKIIKKNN